MNIFWNGDHLAEKVRIAGFQDVTHKKVKIRIGNWGDGKHNVVRLADGR